MTHGVTMKIMHLTLLFTITFTTTLVNAKSGNTIKQFWPNIPFNIQGANLCEFRSAFSQTRSGYMREMVNNAERLLLAGDTEPLKTLQAFNEMYEKNLVYAKRGVGVLLESTFKSYIESYYRKNRPSTRYINFKFPNSLHQALNRASRGEQISFNEQNSHLELDLMAYGTYSISPNCNGNVVVTLNVVEKDLTNTSFTATGRPSTVMSQIASRVFEKYQRTQFPSTIRIKNRKLQILGGLNTQIDSTPILSEARYFCESMDARLPTAQEYKYIDSYGSWSGGVSLGTNAWALKHNYVFYLPFVKNGSAAVPASRIDHRRYHYLCVR